jgi:hypothetical protein
MAKILSIIDHKVLLIAKKRFCQFDDHKKKLNLIEGQEKNCIHLWWVKCLRDRYMQRMIIDLCARALHNGYLKIVTYVVCV